MNYKIVLLYSLLYTIGIPLFIIGITALHKKFFITDKKRKLPLSKQNQMNFPDPLYPIYKERMKFSTKDKTPVSIKKKTLKVNYSRLLLILWGVGLLISIIAGLFNSVVIFLFSVAVFIIRVMVGMTHAKPILQHREKNLKKIFDIGSSTLGLRADNPQEVVTITEWRDVVKPTKIKIQIPTTFNASGEDNFLNMLNQVFGSESSWVADLEEGGWNYEDGVVAVKEMPPLPQMAPWSEHYVLDEGVAWSFFPVALGVEDGIEIPNPKTGQMENVLGFDLSGLQSSASKKVGRFCSPKIVTSPMVLVGGGTGGGKALSSKTRVKTIKNT